MELLRRTFNDSDLILELKESNMENIFDVALDTLIANKKLKEEQKDEVLTALLKNEGQSSSTIGHSVLVPHAYVESIEVPSITFIRLNSPINMGAPDGIPVRFIFVLIGSEKCILDHLETLTRIAKLMTDDEFRFDALYARNKEDLLTALDSAEPRITGGAKESQAEKAFEHSGKLFGGIVNDIKRRLPHYLADFKDGFHLKSLGSIIFILFASLAPAVTFGGFMSVYTEGQIGIVEMLLGTSICGILYSLFSGQPLIILGGTGPLLIFTSMVFSLCAQLNLPFLPVYAWIGIWSGIILFVLAAFEASVLMKYFTRFTDEIYVTLISLIFIYEAVRALYTLLQKNMDNQAVCLLSLLLALGTFVIAMNLSRFRKSHYLVHSVREVLADFGPAIAIGIMTFAAISYDSVNSPGLPAPEVFGTTTGRPWAVPFTELPISTALLCIIPALLLSVLIFLEQNITGRLINSPDHKLTKGEAYHLDLSLIGVLTAFTSIFGLPWLVGANVRSLNHLRSLATVEDKILPGGKSKEMIIHTRENRITNLVIHLLLGGALFLLPTLKAIPIAVLYGLFFYMGIVSISGSQFVERLNLWLMDRQMYPKTHYIRRVPIKSVHKFTAIQLACLILLWAIKSSPLGLLFPLFIALMAPLRIFIGKFFSPPFLEALDSAETPEDEEDRVAA